MPYLAHLAIVTAVKIPSSINLSLHSSYHVSQVAKMLYRTETSNEEAPEVPQPNKSTRRERNATCTESRAIKYYLSWFQKCILDENL